MNAPLLPRSLTVPLLSLVTWALVSHSAIAVAEEADNPTKVSTFQEFLLDPVDAKRDRIVPIKVYLPATEKPAPLILFSHGLGGSRDNNVYLGRHWAENGYVAVFMQHIGSDESVWKGVPRTGIMAAMKRAASFQSHVDRIEDVSFVIDQLERWNVEAEHQLAGRVDLEHIGMSGHSFGAVTTLAVSGRKYPGDRSYPEPRIDAFMPFSPQAAKGMPEEKSLGHLSAPFLCMTGTLDDSPLDPAVTPETRREVYAALPEGNKYHLVFEGGHHFTFSDAGGRRNQDSKRDPKHHPTIQKLSTKFWDAYLKNDAEALAWLQSEKPREACDMHEKDVWEWK